MKFKSFPMIGLGLLTVGLSLASFTKSVKAQTSVSIQSFNFPDRYIRHRNFLGYLETASDDLAAKDSSYKLVPGLANRNCTSIESINFPGYFLRHQNSRIKLSPKTNTRDIFKGDITFKADATFCRRIGVFGQKGISFESMNIPGHFIRHRNLELWIDRSDGTDLFRKDATFSLIDSLAK